MGDLRLSSSPPTANAEGVLDGATPERPGQVAMPGTTWSEQAATESVPQARTSSSFGVVWAVVVVAASGIVFGLPSPIHVTAPGARAAIETLIATGALLGAAALWLSFRHGHRRSDLLLLTALGTIGLSDFVFLALPALTDARLLGFGSALEVACQMLAAVAFAVAAFTPAGTLAGTGLRTFRVAAAAAAATVALGALVYFFTRRSTLDAAFPQAGLGAAAQHPVLLAEALVSAAILLVSGVVFLGRPERDSYALAGASFLLAAARIQYLALPVVSQDWVTAREGLRLAAYALVLSVAIGRYVQTRREIAAAALVVERERIARDLHDGLAQDLAFIALQGQQLSTELGDEHPLTEAARRAVAASRGVIVDLSASTAASTETALRQVADELAVRFEIEVDVRITGDLDESARHDLEPPRRDEVVRIAREAIVNAARHGRARHVTVALDRSDDQVRLRVSDDGRGIPHSKLRGQGGYGLQMMRARAAALGGRLVTRRRIDGGAEVELTFPRRPAVAR